jgi:hypothetical protein
MLEAETEAAGSGSRQSREQKDPAGQMSAGLMRLYFLRHDMYVHTHARNIAMHKHGFF